MSSGNNAIFYDKSCQELDYDLLQLKIEQLEEELLVAKLEVASLKRDVAIWYKNLNNK